jgi:phospholipid transport system substrate-binding protein
LGLFLGTTTLTRAQTPSEEAARFVQKLGNEAVGIVGTHRVLTSEKRQAALRDLIERGFNLRLTSQFVLGKYWQRATPEQRAEFQDLFTQYLVNSYARHLGSVRAETLTIVASHAVGEKDVLVETSIESTDGIAKPVWRVRSQEGQYKIIDVSVDGVSLALTQRREFASVANREGLDGLLKMLREKLADQAQAAQRRMWQNDSHVSLLASILASPNASKIGILLARR